MTIIEALDIVLQLATNYKWDEHDARLLGIKDVYDKQEEVEILRIGLS